MEKQGSLLKIDVEELAKTFSCHEIELEFPSSCEVSVTTGVSSTSRKMRRARRRRRFDSDLGSIAWVLNVRCRMEEKVCAYWEEGDTRFICDRRDIDPDSPLGWCFDHCKDNLDMLRMRKVRDTVKQRYKEYGFL